MNEIHASAHLLWSFQASKNIFWKLSFLLLTFDRMNVQSKKAVTMKWFDIAIGTLHSHWGVNAVDRGFNGALEASVCKQ